MHRRSCLVAQRRWSATCSQIVPLNQVLKFGLILSIALIALLFDTADLHAQDSAFQQVCSTGFSRNSPGFSVPASLRGGWIPHQCGTTNGVISLIAQTPPALKDTLPGAYLSWWKLLLIIFPFIFWVRTADWLNRDAMKIGRLTDLRPEVWNPINIATFLAGFFAAISIPIFFVGYPIYVVAAMMPFLIYFFVRRSKIKAQPTILDHVKSKPGTAPPSAALPQDEGADVEFTPAGADAKEKQVNLIRARQTGEGFPTVKNMIEEGLNRRADLILMDYTREKVNTRFLVDGAWHAFPPMDRQIGDAVLVSLKSLAGLNGAERRAPQLGNFSLKTADEKAGVELSTKGVPSGERAQIKFKRKSKIMMPLGQLGMFPEMVARISTALNNHGLTVISAPAGDGLTTSWQGALMTTDRMTRDCVAVLNDNETDTTVENILIHRYGSESNKPAMEVMSAMLLTQPDFVAMPEIEDAAMMDLMTLQVKTQNRSILMRTPAKSAAEALLRVYAKAGDRQQFIDVIKYVTGQRLVRRLCDECKQEVRVPPKTIQLLGGDPRKQQTIFNQYQLPPPEQRVDEKGKPIEFPPCPVCAGIGYIGRIAAYELIEVNDQIRAVMKKSPNAAAIEKAAIQTGKKPLVNEAYRFVLLGITSLAEVQRVFKGK